MSLMKYLTAPGLDLLEQSRIRVCKFASTNDPTEGLAALDYPTDKAFWGKDFEARSNKDPIFWKASLLKKYAPTEFENMKEQYAVSMISQKAAAEKELPIKLLEGISQMVFFISMTESYPNETLWTRYAASHHGFIVEFEDGHPFFQQCIHPSGLLKRIVGIQYNSEMCRVEFGSHAPPVELLFSKLSKQWQEEDEIRILLFHTFCSADHGCHYADVPRESIRGVILGSRCAANVRDRINKINDDLFLSKLVIRDELR